VFERVVEDADEGRRRSPHQVMSQSRSSKSPRGANREHLSQDAAAKRRAAKMKHSKMERAAKWRTANYELQSGEPPGRRTGCKRGCRKVGKIIVRVQKGKRGNGGQPVRGKSGSERCRKERSATASAGEATVRARSPVNVKCVRTLCGLINHRSSVYK
jgi:hypothetical protein